MGKKKKMMKQRIQNPQRFDPYGTKPVVLKKRRRSKAPKKHQTEGNLIQSNISSKIMKEALIQLKEVHHDEEDNHNNNNNTNGSFFYGIEEPSKVDDEHYDDDMDNFAGFPEAHSHYGEYEEEISEEDQRIMEAFLSKGQEQQKSLAHLVVKKIKEKDESVASDIRPEPKMDKSRIDIYKRVGIHLSKYTAGKIPKPFKCIPSLQDWEQVLYITEPENWSPNAMFQATRMFASNFGVEKAARFYKLFLLPRVREDIRKNKRLHFALYRSLKKALYKPGAFFKGIVFPLCESRTCTVREAHIIRSIIEKVSIPAPYSSAALVMLDGMEYWGIISFFIKLLVEKKYALPFSAVDVVVAHFMRFLNETGKMHVIWHQSLLAFVQRYKDVLQREDKDNLKVLVEKHYHNLITPEIIEELNISINRGEKEDNLMAISSPAYVMNKTIEEDRFDIPNVPMEED